MKDRRNRPAVARSTAWAAVVVSALSLVIAGQTGNPLPAQLTDQQFWELSQSLSEPGGKFFSDNLVSNEIGFQKVLPALTERHAPGNVYLGVGPEQNFTYIAALHPAAAFIIDLRRENRDLHLMYKTLFEMARDRAEFVSLLFSLPRPDGLGPNSTVDQLFTAFATVEESPLFQDTLHKLKRHLAVTHHLPLSAAEMTSIEYIFRSFATFGIEIHYGSSRSRGPSSEPLITRLGPVNYQALMLATDSNDQPSSYLASEERFAVVKALHARNLIVPVVGDFAGPRAIRAVGDWIRSHKAVVSAFYLSNVEDYLEPQPLMTTFCQNAASLPIEDNADFIRSNGRVVANQSRSADAPGRRPANNRRAEIAVDTATCSDRNPVK